MTAQQRQIIFVDDDPGIRDVAKLILEREGYVVSVFVTGEALFESNFSLPDIFILDKQLPGIDGIEVCKRLKSDDRTGHIPVIMVSASPQGVPLDPPTGADGFLEKPFSIKGLTALVAGHLADHSRDKAS